MKKVKITSKPFLTAEGLLETGNEYDLADSLANYLVVKRGFAVYCQAPKKKTVKKAAKKK